MEDKNKIKNVDGEDFVDTDTNVTKEVYDDIAKTHDDMVQDDAKEEDNRSVGEKIEDGMDAVVEGVQNFFYGERKSFDEDIPATIVDPDNEIRHVNKVQTRRNFNKRYGKKFIKWIFIIIAVGLVVSLGYGLIEKLLMA